MRTLTSTLQAAQDQSPHAPAVQITITDSALKLTTPAAVTNDSYTTTHYPLTSIRRADNLVWVFYAGSSGITAQLYNADGTKNGAATLVVSGQYNIRGAMRRSNGDVWVLFSPSAGNMSYAVWNGTSWGAPVAIPASAIGTSYFGGTIVESPDGSTIWLVTFDTTAYNDLKLSYSTNGGSTWSTVTSVSTNTYFAASAFLSADSSNVYLTYVTNLNNAISLRVIKFIGTASSYQVQELPTVFTDDGTNYTIRVITPVTRHLSTGEMVIMFIRNNAILQPGLTVPYYYPVWVKSDTTGTHFTMPSIVYPDTQINSAIGGGPFWQSTAMALQSDTNWFFFYLDSQGHNDEVMLVRKTTSNTSITLGNDSLQYLVQPLAGVPESEQIVININNQS